MARANERAGPHPFQLSIRLCIEVLNRAPFGAGRSSGRASYRAQHDTRGCGEGFRYANGVERRRSRSVDSLVMEPRKAMSNQRKCGYKTAVSGQRTFQQCLRLSPKAQSTI
eukprot:6463989-Amphidinium_carterae.1